MCGVDNRGVEHLARAVNNRNLAARAVARVESEHGFALNRRLHKELLKVQREHLYRVFVSGFRELRADFTLDRGEDKPCVSVLAGGSENIRAKRICTLVKRTVDNAERLFAVKVNAYLQKALFFASVKRQNTVAGNLFNRLAVVVIIGVNAVLLLVSGNRLYRTAVPENNAQALANFRTVGQLLRNNVHRAVNRVLSRGDFLFLVNKLPGVINRVKALFLLDNFKRERFKSALLGYGSPRLSFWLVRTINILELA